MILSQLEVTGAEVYSVSLADKLIERGHRVFIVSDTLTRKTKAEYIKAPISNRSFSYRIKNSIFLYKLIKQKNIHVVNAHSRASAWVSNIACKLSNVPLIVFIHGRQSTFLSRRLFHCFGNYTIAICEKLEQQLLEIFKVTPDKVEVLRNGFALPKLEDVDLTAGKTVSFVTRLSGPKEDLAYIFLEHLLKEIEYSNEFRNVKFKVIGGATVPERFTKFKKHIDFTGYVEDLEKHVRNSSVVIGSGRVAIGSILLNKPLIAMGEACTIGLVTKDNLNFALATNFGDMNETEKVFDFQKIIDDLKLALNISECDPVVHDKVKQDCDIEKIVGRLEYVFQSVRVRYYKREIPVIYYHRLVKNLDEAGRHGIYVTEDQFEKHLKYLKRKNYTTISFEKALEIKKNCTDGKYIIITFDDGYEDNYTLAFPLLKKYGFSAIIFLVAGLEYNSWDNKDNEPKLKMMSRQQILEMRKSGIEFGSHTLSHADLIRISSSEIKNEVVESKKKLEEKLGEEIPVFAYPYGNCNDEVKDIVKNAGYKLGYATDKAPMGLHEDLLQIRRIGIYPNTNVAGFARKVKGNYIFKRVKKDSSLLSIPS
jgi:peptidoglycan/xylan/chitin deacetylase (PgdA/CDA1 family)